MKSLCPLLIVLLCLFSSSCGTKRQAGSSPSGYAPELSAEEMILQELKNSRPPQGTFARLLLDEAYTWQGTPYLYGGQSKLGADCSGFVMVVFINALDIKLPRNSAKQSDACKKIGIDEVVPGDLLFFRTSAKKQISHVGIYVGDGKMIHASTRGVVIDNILTPYFQRCFHHAGRVKKFASLLKKERK